MTATPTQLVLGAAAYWVGKRIEWDGMDRLLTLPAAVHYGATLVPQANNGELRAAFNALHAVGVPGDMIAYSNSTDTAHLIEDLYRAIRILRTG